MNHYEKNMGQNKGAPDCWCPLPWSHINIKSSGIYRLCDHSNSSKSKGTLRDREGNPLSITEKVDWESVMNSDVMKSIRKNMLAGRWSSECARCEREHSSGMRAHNIYERSELAGLIEPENYPGYLKAKSLTQSNGSISLKDFPISFLNIRFGNLCNLRCAMCGPVDSSAWHKEYDVIWGHYGKKMIYERDYEGTGNIFNWSDNQNLWLQIKKHIKQFRKIYIVGGEPLLMKSYYKFLQWCVNNGVSEKLTIEFNSNITVIPPQAYDLWRHFKKVSIGISLDGFGEINDFIRYPSRWNHVEQNVSWLDELEEQNIVLYIITSVSVLNIWHFPEFIEYLMRKNHNHIGLWQDRIINAHPVHKPPYLNINILGEDFKEQIRIRFEEYKEKFSNYDWQSACGVSRIGCWEEKIVRVCKILDDYVRFMQQVPHQPEELIKQRSRFIYYMDKLDELRGTNWLKVFPELYESTLKWRELKSPEKCRKIGGQSI